MVNFGKRNTAESRKAYERVVAKWLQAGKPISVPNIVPRSATVGEVVAMFERSGKIRDSKRHHHKIALGVLEQLHGCTSAKHFDGQALMAVRSKRVDRQLGRNTI